MAPQVGLSPLRLQPWPATSQALVASHSKRASSNTGKPLENGGWGKESQSIPKTPPYNPNINKQETLTPFNFSII